MAFTNTTWVKWWDREEEMTKKSDRHTLQISCDASCFGLAFRRKHTKLSWFQNRYSGLEKNRDPSVRWRMQANHTRNSARGGCHHSKNYNDGVVSKYYSLRKMYVMDMWYATTSLLHDRQASLFSEKTLLVNCYGLLYLLSRSFPSPS